MTYVNSNTENVKLVLSHGYSDIYTVLAKVEEVHTSVYKPDILWPALVLSTYPHLPVYAVDFNSHHGNWKYPVNYKNGEALVN